MVGWLRSVVRARLHDAGGFRCWALAFAPLLGPVPFAITAYTPPNGHGVLFLHRKICNLWLCLFRIAVLSGQLAFGIKRAQIW